MAETTTTTETQQTTQAAPDWRSAIPETLRNDPSLSTFKDVGSLAQSLVETKRMLGSRIPLPNANSKPEDWAEIYNKLGRPETPDKYELPPKEQMSGLELDPNLTKAFLAKFHERGLTSKQVSGILQDYAGMATAQQQQQAEQQQQALQAGQEALRKEWGAGYNDHLAMAQQAVTQLGGAELKEHLNRTGMGNDPVLIKLFATIGKKLGDDTLHGTSTRLTHSPGEAKQAIADLQSDPAFMKQWMDKRAPGHDAAVARMTSLFELLHPQEQK